MLGVEDFSMEDFWLRLICDRRFLASYLGGCGGEDSKCSRIWWEVGTDTMFQVTEVGGKTRAHI